MAVPSDGTGWDCTDAGVGLITWVAADVRRTKVFVDRDFEVGIDEGAWIGVSTPGSAKASVSG